MAQRKLKLVWNTPANCWVMDMLDTEGNPILRGIPLVTGLDLLEQFGYMKLGGQLLVQTDNDPDAVPTFTNLGSEGHFFFLTP